MLDSADCKYIIGEIRNIPYYADKISQCRKKIEELDRELESSSLPSNAWVDVVVTKKNGEQEVVREKVRGHGKTTEERIIDIVVKKDPYEQERKRFLERWADADAYYHKLTSDPEWRDFVEAFFKNESYDSLSINYAVGNPYRQICVIIMNNITRV